MLQKLEKNVTKLNVVIIEDKENINFSPGKPIKTASDLLNSG